MINDVKINTLIDEKKLNKKVAELGNLITEDYKDKYPVFYLECISMGKL